MTNYQRIAVISDIHGNRWALEAVLNDIARRRVDKIVNLGDSVYGPLDPKGTADLIMEKNILSIRGNEDYVLVSEPDDPEAHSSLVFTRENLEPRHIQWMLSLPTTAVVEGMLLCHGTPTNDCEYLIEDVFEDGVFIKSSRGILHQLEGVGEKVVLCGHSHVPRVLYLGDDRWVINAGSVGLQAYSDEEPHPHGMESGSPMAVYCILGLGPGGHIVGYEHIKVAYDWDKAAKVAAENGRMDWNRWLRSGRFNE